MTQGGVVPVARCTGRRWARSLSATRRSMPPCMAAAEDIDIARAAPGLSTRLHGVRRTAATRDGTPCRATYRHGVADQNAAAANRYVRQWSSMLRAPGADDVAIRGFGATRRADAAAAQRFTFATGWSRCGFVAGGDRCRRGWYFKPDAGRLLGSPANADDTTPHDVMPEGSTLPSALIVCRPRPLNIRRPESTWAGLRSFVRDGELVIGFDRHAPGFFWLAAGAATASRTRPARVSCVYSCTGWACPETTAGERALTRHVFAESPA